ALRPGRARRAGAKRSPKENGVASTPRCPPVSQNGPAGSKGKARGAAQNGPSGTGAPAQSKDKARGVSQNGATGTGARGKAREVSQNGATGTGAKGKAREVSQNGGTGAKGKAQGVSQNGATGTGAKAKARGAVGAPPAPPKLVALDCEMVGTGPGGRTSALARCSIVTYEGD
ncbi:AEN nuclease, partial [Molothrus ater]|nr:AEN nuclease [Molothrus ater]